MIWWQTVAVKPKSFLCCGADKKAPTFTNQPTSPFMRISPDFLGHTYSKINRKMTTRQIFMSLGSSGSLLSVMFCVFIQQSVAASESSHLRRAQARGSSLMWCAPLISVAQWQGELSFRAELPLIHFWHFHVLGPFLV